MPRATIDTTATERFDLKSLPAVGDEEAGWVELRKLSYGQILARRDMATGMAIEGLGDIKDSGEDIKATIDIIQKTVIEFEFKNCIANHNLEDETGKKLNFSNPVDVNNLDPIVGQEIGDLIDNLNKWDTDPKGKDEQTSEQESEQVLF